MVTFRKQPELALQMEEVGEDVFSSRCKGPEVRVGVMGSRSSKEATSGKGGV